MVCFEEFQFKSIYLSPPSYYPSLREARSELINSGVKALAYIFWHDFFDLRKFVIRFFRGC